MAANTALLVAISCYLLLFFATIEQKVALAFLTRTSQENQSRLLASTSPLVDQDSPKAIIEFTSPKFSVYIEDTDAYGVMNNSNYARQYERALSHAPRDNRKTKRTKWVLTELTNQKFRTSPKLGGDYVVKGQLIESTSAGVEVWKMEMVSVPSDVDKKVLIYNAATVTLTLTPCHSIISPDEDTSSEELCSYKQSFPCYPDEFDIHLQTTTTEERQAQYSAHHIPIRSVTNFFERHRTTLLGGPDKLNKLQQEDGIIFVVTAIDDGEIFLDAIGSANVGKDVIVETKFVAKRRGMVVECNHRLLMDIEGESGNPTSTVLLAKATITIMALDRKTLRPTSKLPQWVMDIIF